MSELPSVFSDEYGIIVQRYLDTGNVNGPELDPVYGVAERLINKKLTKFPQRYHSELFSAGMEGLVRALHMFREKPEQYSARNYGNIIAREITNLMLAEYRGLSTSVDVSEYVIKNNEHVLEQFAVGDESLTSAAIYADDIEESAIALAALDSLSDDDKRLVLMYAAGYTYREIAPVFGVSHVTILNRHNKIRSQVNNRA